MRELLDYGWNESLASVKKRRIVLKLHLRGDRSGSPKRGEVLPFETRQVPSKTLMC